MKRKVRVYPPKMEQGGNTRKTSKQFSNRKEGSQALQNEDLNTFGQKQNMMFKDFVSRNAIDNVMRQEMGAPMFQQGGANPYLDMYIDRMQSMQPDGSLMTAFDAFNNIVMSPGDYKMKTVINKPYRQEYRQLNREYNKDMRQNAWENWNDPYGMMQGYIPQYGDGGGSKEPIPEGYIIVPYGQLGTPSKQAIKGTYGESAELIINPTTGEKQIINQSKDPYLKAKSAARTTFKRYNNQPYNEYGETIVDRATGKTYQNWDAYQAAINPTSTAETVQQAISGSGASSTGSSTGTTGSGKQQVGSGNEQPNTSGNTTLEELGLTRTSKTPKEALQRTTGSGQNQYDPNYYGQFMNNPYVLYPKVRGTFSRTGRMPLYVDPRYTNMSSIDFRRAISPGNRVKRITFDHYMPGNDVQMFNPFSRRQSSGSITNAKNVAKKNMIPGTKQPVQEIGQPVYGDIDMWSSPQYTGLGTPLGIAPYNPNYPKPEKLPKIGTDNGRSVELFNLTNPGHNNHVATDPVDAFYNQGIRRQQQFAPGRQFQAGGQGSINDITPYAGLQTMPNLYDLQMEQMNADPFANYTPRQVNPDLVDDTILPQQERKWGSTFLTHGRNWTPMIGPGMDVLAAYGRRRTAPDFRRQVQDMTAAENVFTSRYGNRGFNTFNPIGFDPGTGATPVQFTGFKCGGSKRF